MQPFIANLGPTELFIILGIVILLFGAAKLPELARGSGRALRIFKSETKGLLDEDRDSGERTAEQRELAARRVELERRQAELDRERDRLEQLGGA